ncbi:MAG TPA: hypothetical protein VNK96_09020 [Fimbriimonadales bacterium]|nr:hypothetical protein [Fimbriimonadales bacterium]
MKTLFLTAFLSLVFVGCIQTGARHSNSISVAGGGVASLDGLVLINLRGEEHPAEEVLRDAKAVFFTCGCEPCKKEASRVSHLSDQIACISYLSIEELGEFVRIVGWKGEVWRDPGMVVENKLGIFDCPKFMVNEQGKMRMCNVNELRAFL